MAQAEAVTPDDRPTAAKVSTRSDSSLQGQAQVQNQGDTYSKSEDDPDVPDALEPALDRTGQTPQRMVEQKKKREELIKVDRRLNGLESNDSRSTSRRSRRKRVKNDQQNGRYMHINSLTALEEADASNEMKCMQPFERIGPDSTSMDGPVTMARAERGEIAVRGTNPDQPYHMKPKPKEKSKLADTDGLKLTLEANLEIEIELKASISGDLTLSLFA